MYRLFFIAKNNMKKQKSDMITFFIMTFLSSFMIYLCLNLFVGTFRLCNTNKEVINGADIIFLRGNDDISGFKLKEIIQGNENVTNYEENKYLSTMSKYRKQGDLKWSNYSFAFASYDDEREYQTVSINTKRFYGSDIVLPVTMSTNFTKGDIIEFKFGENIYDFKVAGFNEDYVWSSPVNLGAYYCYISEKMYERVEFESRKNITPGYLVKVQLSKDALKNHVSASDATDEILGEYNMWLQSYQNMHPDYVSDISNEIPCDTFMMTGMILPFIFIAVILVFALIILGIALVVIDFSVKNFIMDNMKNIGIMEAGGYTVKEMIGILLMQLLSVSLAGSFFGTLLAFLIQGKIGFIMLYLLGLSWNQKADMTVLAVVVLGICTIISIFTLLLGRQYKKTSVLEALRGGIQTHNFRKNLFPFDKTNLPVSVTVALKETFGKFKSQIGVIVIIAILAFSAGLGFGIYEVMSDADALLNFCGLDIADASFPGDQNMYNTVEKYDSVESMRREYWWSLDLVSGNKVKRITTRCISDTSSMKTESMVEGRWPKYENEIALGVSAAESLEKKAGDTVIVRNGEEEASYLVTGIYQTMNNMGMMVYCTTDAFERIGSLPDEMSTYVNLKKGYTFDDFEKVFKGDFPDTEVNDEYASMGGLFTTISASIKAVMFVIMLVTAFIVALSEALLIRTRITKEWKNFGIHMALGFTSGQLNGQILVSNLPAVIIGIAFGLTIVSAFGDKVVLLMFSMFGFQKVAFRISPLSYMIVIAVIAGVAMLVTWLNGTKIKKLEPVKMITEE